MKKKSNRYIYILAILVLIIAGVVTTALISSARNKESPADIRARAGVVSTLKFTGTVSDLDTGNVTITVDNVVLHSESRSGQEVNYGTWVVTPPRTFNMFNTSVGETITFVVNSDSLDVASRQVVASQIITPL